MLILYMLFTYFSISIILWAMPAVSIGGLLPVGDFIITIHNSQEEFEFFNF